MELGPNDMIAIKETPMGIFGFGYMEDETLLKILGVENLKDCKVDDDSAKKIAVYSRKQAESQLQNQMISQFNCMDSKMKSELITQFATQIYKNLMNYIAEKNK